MQRAIRAAVKDVTDKVEGVVKMVSGLVTRDEDQRSEGQAQLAQAHVEPELETIDLEDRRRDAPDQTPPL